MSLSTNALPSPPPRRGKYIYIGCFAWPLVQSQSNKIQFWSSGPANRKHSKLGANAIYVGRPTKWSNPFPVSKFDCNEAMQKYEEYLFSSGLMNQINELQNCTLVCNCAPLLCHADILLKHLYSLKILEC